MAAMLLVIVKSREKKFIPGSNSSDPVVWFEEGFSANIALPFTRTDDRRDEMQKGRRDGRPRIGEEEIAQSVSIIKKLTCVGAV